MEYYEAAARTGPEDPEKIKQFEMILAEVIKEQYERYSHVTIGVDYGPDRTLYEAAEKAGIKGMHFPIKTMMWVSPEKISVQKGGGNPIITIFPKK